jgi:pyruvate dehydrogenase E1 component alpha subunit
MTAKTMQKAAPPAAEKTFSLISDEKLIQLYTTLLKCRIFEQRVNLLLSKRKASGNRRFPAGREAAATGVVLNLLPGDIVAPSSRDLVPNLIHGVPLATILRPLLGRAASPANSASSFERNGHEALLATGVALANKIARNNKIAVIFQGSDSNSLDSWNHALHFVGLHRLPILFVSCNHMQPQLAEPKPQAEAGLSEPPVLSFPAIRVDGNDVVAIYRVATEAIAHARKGSGPTLIDCRPYLPNNRNQAALHADDPILNMEQYLTQKGLFSPSLKARTITLFDKQFDAAIRLAQKASRARKAGRQDPIVLFPSGSGA